jgi:hypothetical protein
MQAQTITRSIRYTVPSKSGGADHTVTVDPRDARTACDCRAGSFGKDCHAQKAVRAGQAGRPVVRVSQRPVAAAPVYSQRARFMAV